MHGPHDPDHSDALVWQELQIQTEDLRVAHDRARRALERYRALFQDSPVCHLVVDAQGSVLEAHGEDLAGLGALTADGFRERVHPEDTALLEAHLRSVFRDQEHTSCRIRVSDDEAAYHVVKLDSAPMPCEGEPRQARTVLSRPSSPEAVEPQLEQAAALLDRTEGVLHVDARGIVQWASGTAHALFRAPLTGPDGSGLVHRNIAELFEGPPLADLESAIRRGFDGTQRAQLLAVRADRSSFPADVRLVHRPELAPGTLLVLHDRSIEHHLQTELNQSQRLEALGRFAGNVMLEIQNVLSGVHAAAEVSLQHLGNRNAARPPMKMIRQATDTALELARLVLTLEHRRADEMQAVVLDERLTEMRPLLDRLAGDRVAVGLRLSAPGRVVRLQQGSVVQLLVNLVTNACDAMPEGGTVMLSTEVTEGRGGQGGDWIVLEVSDTGRGIDPADLERVFEPFVTSAADGGRQGLGLSTVRNLVERAGGTVTVSAEPGEGARFRISLPCWHTDQATVADAEPDDRPCENCVVLALEGASLSLLGMEHSLRQAGHRVVAASSPTDAEWALEAVGSDVDTIIVSLDDADDAFIQMLRTRLPHAHLRFVTGDPAQADDQVVFLRPVHAPSLVTAIRKASERLTQADRSETRASGGA